MLIYHPAYDIYHCIFRFLRLLEILPKVPHEADKLRILDFYLLFPHLLKEVLLPLEARSYRKTINKLDEPYENVKDPHKMFLKLETFQLSALRCLASCNIIDINEFSSERIMRTKKKIPEQLLATINKTNSDNPDLVNLLTGPLFDLAFYGDKGLKARTKLMEYRYDIK